MNDRLLALAARQGALRERIARQREQLAGQIGPLESTLAVADKVLAGVDWVKHHPQAVFATALLLVVWRPRRVWRWGLRGLTVWRGWRALREKLTSLTQGA